MRRINLNNIIFLAIVLFIFSPSIVCLDKKLIDEKTQQSIVQLGLMSELKPENYTYRSVIQIKKIHCCKYEFSDEDLCVEVYIYPHNLRGQNPIECKLPLSLFKNDDGSFKTSQDLISMENQDEHIIFKVNENFNNTIKEHYKNFKISNKLRKSYTVVLLAIISLNLLKILFESDLTYL